MESDVERSEVTEVAEDETVVVQIGWVHAAVFFVVVIGIGGALLAGLWMGRSLNGSSGSPATANSQEVSTGQQPVVQVQPQQAPPAQSQPRAQAQPAAPSSAGITTTFGRTPSVGDVAPDFTLKNLEGEKVSLSDFEGQPALINFWATWCAPCRIEMPLIEQMYQKYQDEGFVVLAVDVQESLTAVQWFVDNQKLTFPVLLDHDGEVANETYRIRAFPTSYFVGRDGKITSAHRGMMDQQAMQRYMDQVLATQPAE